MRGGKLRHYITIQIPTISRDEYGTESITYATAAQVWADVIVKSATELTRSDTFVHHTVYQITVRHRTDIQPNWRIILPDSTTLEVQSSYDPDGRSRETIIEAIKVST